MAVNMIVIEVAYALPTQQFLLTEQVAEGTTVGEALAQSAIQQQVPHLELIDGKVGIFGKIVKLTQVLKAGDRIEIYRPLVNDPKEARRRKAMEVAKG